MCRHSTQQSKSQILHTCPTSTIRTYPPSSEFLRRMFGLAELSNLQCCLPMDWSTLTLVNPETLKHLTLPMAHALPGCPCVCSYDNLMPITQLSLKHMVDIQCTDWRAGVLTLEHLNRRRLAFSSQASVFVSITSLHFTSTHPRTRKSLCW